ncbi:MAG: acetyl-CoA carboxylase biotin carboxyl carrier protein subunit [Anaerolineales bacterium]|nr:acetyl-CoA carboxylase biotin carboxyl carrier protein subunit [Anaerolineales bacterium]
MKIKVRIKQKTYEVEVDNIDHLPVLARIGDETFEVWPENLEKLQPGTELTGMTWKPETFPKARRSSHKQVLAPMPGTIYEIVVKPGLKVEAGDTLLVIEAMKMKNHIRAGRCGVIGKIDVTTGETVKARQLLLEYAD